MTIDTDKTIYVAIGDTNIHVLVPRHLKGLVVELLDLRDPDPDNNDGPVYQLASAEMEETSFYDAI